MTSGNPQIKQPLTVSIITVCRNSADTIENTIESVLAQKDAGIEYIIIDGASTDATLEIVRNYPEIDVVVSEPDRGIADAFNKGIQLARGEIIGLINSDDQLLPNTLAKVVTFFDDQPETDVVHGDLLLYQRGRLIKRLKPAGRWWYPWRLVLFNHPATFVRRHVYVKHGLFDTTYRIAMDVEIFLRWMSCGVVIRYLPEVLTIMETGGASGQLAITGYREARQAAVLLGYSQLLSMIQYWGKRAGWRFLELVTAVRSAVRPYKP